MTTVATVPIYLSRLVLDPRSRQVRSELAHPYEMHRTLMCAFPAAEGENAREKYGVLFRAEIGDHRAVVYVQSAVEPDWSVLGTRSGYLFVGTDLPNLAFKDVTEAYRDLQDGQVLSFRLRANPTKRIGKVTKGDLELKGKRVALLREEEQIAWLIRKGQEREKGRPGGFEILASEVRDDDGRITQLPRVNVCVEGRRNSRKKEHKTTHFAVRFDGLLRVTDADAFRETVARGIGSAKAFGFGLLSLAPGETSSAREAR